MSSACKHPNIQNFEKDTVHCGGCRQYSFYTKCEDCKEDLGTACCGKGEAEFDYKGNDYE